MLLLQVALILLLARTLRWLFIPLRQPAVIAEMTAGLLIGPSALGWLSPRASAALFPASSLPALNVLSQIGLVLFMFTLGVRVGRSPARANRRMAGAISIVSIAVPFALGTASGMWLHGRLAPSNVGVWPFSLFFGIAMSITAFPVLARILADQKLLETELGQLAIACAAFDDVVGWLILAAILSAFHLPGSFPVQLEMASLLAYLVVMIWCVRPLLAWAANRSSEAGTSADWLVLLLIVTLASAATTEAIGVHALFGAFFAGLMAPRTAKVDRAMDLVEPVTMTLLLPLFFAVTGLRTSLGLIGSATLARDAAIILIAAFVGKGGASMLAARAMGSKWRRALALGVLLNTRGLVELVVLNIGLDTGILSPAAFAMLVMMALITTFVASPLLTSLAPTRPVAVSAAS